jgi:hypothetical protein
MQAMGIVIEFTGGQRGSQSAVRQMPDEPGEVVILPVVRIERDGGHPRDGESGSTTNRRRRRRLRS